MFRKIFYLLVVGALYFWFASNDDERLAGWGKKAFSYAKKAWEDLDYEWHVHGFSDHHHKKRRR